MSKQAKQHDLAYRHTLALLRESSRIGNTHRLRATMRRLLPLLAVAAAQEDFGNMFGAAPARDATRGMPHAWTGPPRRYRRDAATRHATAQASRSTVPRTSAQKKRRPCRTACPLKRRRAAATRSTLARACRCADPASAPINQGPSSFFGGRRHVHASTP